MKAFRDTWRDGIHSYLTYLRDRLTVARDLLTESGSVFVQIGDENLHRIRALMDEVFGDENFVITIAFKKKSATVTTETVLDYIIWFARNRPKLKVREFFEPRNSPEGEAKFNTIIDVGGTPNAAYKLSENEISSLLSSGGRWARVNYPIVSQDESSTRSSDFAYRGKLKTCGRNKHWRFSLDVGLPRLEKAGRLFDGGGASLGGVVFWNDWNQVAQSNIWEDMHGEKFPTYVVQTATKAIQRCILMTTDPGDLVLDPTCGSGTSAFVAEQWGRRWITVDTSRVALALARARIMGARYPWYLLADSREGQLKEGEVTRSVPKDTPTRGRLRQGFVYRRVPHIKLKSVADNAEIDTIWDSYEVRVSRALRNINEALSGTHLTFEVATGGRAGQTIHFDLDADDGVSSSGDEIPESTLQEWEVPRGLPADWPDDAREWHLDFWQARIERQREIDASIAAKANTEYLYDQPYVDNARVRVAGPFTVESLSPHRVPAVDVDDSLFDQLEAAEGRRRAGEIGGGEAADFAGMVLDNLRKSGVQQRAREDRLVFSTLKPWPGKWLCAEGRVRQSSDAEDTPERRAAILIGPEYGTVARADLTAAAREAMEAGFDLLIAAAFNFDAHAGEFDRMGALTVLQARINPDLHMPDLANTGAGNLFTVFGEPDIAVHEEADGMVSIEVAGIDMYKGGQIESGSADDIAVWFIDTDYNYESFFVRHAYFPGANDPYKALKTTLKAEIDAEAWESLKRTRSRPFVKPAGGRVAVKVINHLGDEVMKVVEV